MKSFNDMVKKQRNLNRINKSDTYTKWYVCVDVQYQSDCGFLEYLDRKPTLNQVFNLCLSWLPVMFKKSFEYQQPVIICDKEYPFEEVYNRMGLEKEWLNTFKEQLSYAYNDVFEYAKPSKSLESSYNYEEIECVGWDAGFKFKQTGDYVTLAIYRSVRVLK